MNLIPQLANPSHAEAIVRLRDDLAAYQAEQGFPQWRPGEVTIEQVTRQVEAGEWFVIADNANLVGAIRIIWGDAVIWPEGGESGHIHGLMVRRDAMNRGIATRMLAWAEDRIRKHGKPVARLDCAMAALPLRAFYRKRGYVEVGEVNFPPELGYTAGMRFEKSLTRVTSDEPATAYPRSSRPR
jgi:GNAT superfamily N-acetyltransferase